MVSKTVTGHMAQSMSPFYKAPEVRSIPDRHIEGKEIR